jgi:folate-binding protein YgfZ
MDGIAAEVRAVRENVGLCAPMGRSLIRISGEDRRTWLQGQISNDVLGLPDGQGFEAVILTVQGHLLSHLRVFALPDALLLDLPAATTERVLKTLDRYLILEQVEIEDVSGSFRLFSLQGPRAVQVVERLPGGIASLAPWGVVEVEGDGAPLIASRVSHTGEDGFDLFVPTDGAAELEGRLRAEVLACGGAVVGDAALEVLRIEAGIPIWGRELDESIVPLEARLDHAISRTKGCYVGQEIIARIDARGQVNNLLVGIRPEGTVARSSRMAGSHPAPGRAGGEVVPAWGDTLVSGERAVGRVTSATFSPTLGAPIALGYLRRQFVAPGTPIAIRSTSGDAPAHVAALPFVPRTR